MKPAPCSLLAFGLCAAKVAVHALDAASIRLVFLISPVLWLAILVVGIIEVRRVRDRWSALRWRGLLPVVVCAATLLGSGMFLPVFMTCRLGLMLPQYNAAADGLCAGGELERQRSSPTSLGYWGGAVRNGAAAQPVAAADFLTVTHGFPGHAGYLRLCAGADHAMVWGGDRRPHVWRGYFAHFGRWYLVHD